MTTYRYVQFRVNRLRHQVRYSRFITLICRSFPSCCTRSLLPTTYPAIIVCVIGIHVHVFRPLYAYSQFPYMQFFWVVARIVDNMPITWCYDVESNQKYCSTGFPLGCYVTPNLKQKDACVTSVCFI